jgi:hypothetical protein
MVRDSSELPIPTQLFPLGQQEIRVLCIPDIELVWPEGDALRTQRDSAALNNAIWRRLAHIAMGTWRGIRVESKADLIHALAVCNSGKLSGNIKYLLDDLTRCHPALFKTHVAAPQVPGATDAQVIKSSRIYYGSDRFNWKKKSDPAAIAARATRTARRKLAADAK